jgi:hypothetical protein
MDRVVEGDLGTFSERLHVAGVNLLQSVAGPGVKNATGKGVTNDGHRLLVGTKKGKCMAGGASTPTNDRCHDRVDV